MLLFPLFFFVFHIFDCIYLGKMISSAGNVRKKEMFAQLYILNAKDTLSSRNRKICSAHSGNSLFIETHVGVFARTGRRFQGTILAAC